MNLPPVPDAFHWTRQSWGPALRCRPLEAIAPHLFTTRQLQLSSSEDWRRAAEAVGAADGRVITLTQVHGRDVVVIRQPPTPNSQLPTQGLAHARPEADVLVSNDPGVAIAVRAADCVPILIGDPRTGAVAAVHAGWRGTAAGAAAAAVEALAREFGSTPADLVAAIGPSIGACCYEVGPELVDAFAAAGHDAHAIDAWFRPGATPGTLRLDTWAANRDQLAGAGLDPRNVHACGLCTADHLSHFPSFRAEREKAGRLAGVIRSRP